MCVGGHKNNNIMYRCAQKIEECHYCGKQFEDNEDYWKDSRGRCYCTENKCGWEDDENEDSN